MSKGTVHTTVKHIQKNIPWGRWPSKCHKLLACALAPIQSMSESQKGATKEEWAAIRLNRHLFNRSDLTLPSFVEKQIKATPIKEREYWGQFSMELSEEILSSTRSRNKISKVI